MRLTGKMFRTDQFHYNARTKTFSAEASSLGLKAGELPFAAIYDDACKKVTYFLCEHSEDRDGDQYWSFQPEDVDTVLGARDIYVVIWND